jgi:hypothetical protein
MVALLKFFGVMGLLALAATFNGWVLSILWGWFFVPILGLPALGVAQAIGISTVVGYLTHQHRKTPEGEEAEAFAYIAAQPLFALLIGYIVKSFM